MSEIGHNKGPSMEAGYGWRKHVWTKARADLLPRLPIEVLRLRVKRAKVLGLEYKTYASIRASTGRDVIGFLFSSNALRVLKARDSLPASYAETLEMVQGADLTGLAIKPLTPEQLATRAPMLHATLHAPRPLDSWSTMRDQLSVVLRERSLPADGVVIIGETQAEQEWVAAAKAAYFVKGSAYFANEGMAG